MVRSCLGIFRKVLLRDSGVVITGLDWMKPELQQRYSPHFSPFIMRKIRALRLFTLGIERDALLSDGIRRIALYTHRY